VYALESFWNNQHAQTTERGKCCMLLLLPHIPTAAQALLIGLSRFTLWLDTVLPPVPSHILEKGQCRN